MRRVWTFALELAYPPVFRRMLGVVVLCAAGLLGAREVLAGCSSWVGSCCSHGTRVSPSTGTDTTNFHFEILSNLDEFGQQLYLGENSSGSWVEHAMTYGGNDSGNSWWYINKTFPPGTHQYYFVAKKSGCGDVYDNNGGANYSLTVTDDDTAPPVLSGFFVGGNCSEGVSGISTVLFQGFESSAADTWGISTGSTNISGTTGTGLDQPPGQRILSGSYSWQVSNRVAGVTLTLSNMTIAGYSSRTVEVRVTSTSSSSGNGAETADTINFFVATNGGSFPASADVKISGNSNSRWGYWATNVARTTMGTALNVSSPAANQSTNNYSYVYISIPDAATSISLRVAATNNAQNEIWNVDNIKLTGYSTGGGSLNCQTTNLLTDAQVRNGGWTITGLVQDVGSGVNVNGTTTSGDNFSPNFDVRNNQGDLLFSDVVFSNRPSDGGAMSSPERLAMVTNMPGYSTDLTKITLGSYTVRVSATDNDEDPSATSNDRKAVIDTNVVAFTVIDDDTDCPSFAGFTVRGGSGISTVTVFELSSGSGWYITGLVSDATSGINVNGSQVSQPTNSPYFILRDHLNVLRLTNVFNCGFTDGQATSASAVSNAALGTVASASAGVWTALVVAADNDEDRGNADHQICTGTVSFAVICPTPSTPSANFASSTGSTSFTASWNAATPGVTNYYVDAATAASFAPASYTPGFSNRIAGNVTSLSVTGLTEGQTYYYRIRAENQCAVSLNSATITVTTACFGTPTANAALWVGATSFTASWNTVSGATGYELDVATNSAFGSSFSTLIISEYIESSVASEKYIEIFNGTGSPVDLSDYRLHLYANGGTTPSATINLSGTLANNDVYVIGGSSATNPVADLNTGSLSHNGDDAIALTNTANNTYVDIIGQIGTDPGTEWGSGSTSTADNTIRRQSSITTGDTNPTDAFDPATEWDGYADNNQDDLGSHTAVGGSYVPGYEDRSAGNVTLAGVTGLTEGVTYYYRVRATNAYCTSLNSATISVTTVTQPEMDVLGTNLASIASGDLSPQAADGTDFGSVLECSGGYRDHVFTITNTGSAALILPAGGNVATSGVHAADFIVTALPATNTVAGSNTTFTVRFNPSAPGGRTGLVSIANNDADENPYTFRIVGTGINPEMAILGTNLAEIADGSTGTTGADGTDYGELNVSGGIRNHIFTITNSGTAYLELTGDPPIVSTTGVHAADFIVTALPSTNVAPGGTTTFTVRFDPNATGGRTAEVSIANTDCTGGENPYNFRVTGTGFVSVVVGPTVNYVLADGEQAMDLSWTRNPSLNDVVVFRSTAASPTPPSDGVSYPVGSSLGSGVVVVNGSQTTFKDNELAANTTYYYHFYSVDGTLAYSSAVTSNRVTDNTFAEWEIYESASYTNANSLSGKTGGTGWTNSWTVTSAPRNYDIRAEDVQFAEFSRTYPTNHGNRILIGTSNTSTYAAQRHFEPFTCGQLYVAFKTRYQYTGMDSDQKFHGLGLMDGSTEKAFIGKVSIWDQTAGIEVGGSRDTAGGYLNDTDYLLVGKYDFDTGTLNGLRYTSSSVIPTNEPSWTHQLTGLSFTRIDGVKITAGALSSGWPGQVRFDEIRVARTWGELFNLDPPRVTNYVVDVDNQVSDAQMVAGTYSIRADLFSRRGVDTDGTPFAPDYDLVTPSNRIAITDQDFDSFTYNSGQSVEAADTSHALAVGEVELGIHTVRVSAVASNNAQWLNQSRVAGTCNGLSFTVVDDDTTCPVFSGFQVRGGSGISTVTVFELSSGAGWWVTGLVSDAGSGINVNGSQVSQPTNSPYFVLRDSGNVRRLTNVFNTSFADGGATSASGVSNAALGTVASAASGMWTALVVATDNDEDRGGDRTTCTSEVPFMVICPTPSAPVVNLASATGTTTFTASWNASSPGVTNYILDVSTVSSFASFVSGYNAKLVGNTTSHGVSGLTEGQTYYYRVRAENLCAISANSATITVTTICFGVPTASAATGANSVSFTANWSSVTGATGYEIDVSTNSSFGGTGGGLDLENYTLIQSNATVNYSIPAGTTIQPGGYVIIARDASQAAFESFWGVSLGANVTYINSADTIPQINGSENYTLKDDSGVLVDGTTPNLSSGNTAQRDSTTGSSFTQTADSNATPGSGANGDTTGGLVINEYSDASGGGNFIYEFVELYYDAAGEDFVPGYNDRAVPGVTAVGVTGLVCDTTYYYRIRATNEFCVSLNSSTITVSTTACVAPDMDVLGTNLSSIADGSTSPTAALGTDFGNVFVCGGTRDHVFVVTNVGNDVLVLPDGAQVTTSGVHAADFVVTALPATNMVAGSNSFFTVQFNPGGSGGRTAEVSIANNDPNENPYNFRIIGTGVDPEMRVLGTNLAYIADGDLVPVSSDGTDYRNVVVGSFADHVFTITNAGNGKLELTGDPPIVSTSGVHAADFIVTVLPSTNVAAGATATFTLRFSPSATGGRTAEVVITSTDCDIGTYNFQVSGTGTAVTVTAPSLNYALSDGAEAADLKWTRNSSGNNVLVLHRATNAPAPGPVNGVGYNLNDTIGSGRVLYSGSVTNFKATELGSGTTNFFYLYSYDATPDYSAATTVAVTTETYRVDEIIDVFSYHGTNTPLSAERGGNGWTNAWSVSAPSPGVDVVVQTNRFANFGAAQPGQHANRLILKTSSVADYRAVRYFTAWDCGVIYVAAKMRYEFTGPDSQGKYAGLSLMNGTTEELFLGEVGVFDQTFGVEESGTGNRDVSGGFVNNTDFLIVGKYDFSTDEFDGRRYVSGDVIPTNEPSWDVTISAVVPRIDGIRLSAGANNSGWPGEVPFDEVRVARSWGDLFDQGPPRSTNYAVNGDFTVTDGQMTGGTYSISVDFTSYRGVDTDGTPFAPNFDLLSGSGQPLANEVFDTFRYYSDGLSVAATSKSHAISFANNVLGVTTIRVSSVSSNNASTIDTTRIFPPGCGDRMTFTVVDDDVVGPAFREVTINGQGGLNSNLTVGSIAIIGFNGSRVIPDLDYFTFVVLDPFPAGTVIHFTDNGWTNHPPNGNFRTNESHFTAWTAQVDTVIGQVFSNDIENINSAGDQIVAYQVRSATTNFIYAVGVNQTGWQANAISPETSARYPSLSDGYSSLALTNLNSVYTGTTVGTISELLASISNPTNWFGHPSTVQHLPMDPFSVTGSGTQFFENVSFTITDDQLFHGGYLVTNRVYDLTSGLMASNTSAGSAPYFSIFNSNGVLVVSNAFTVSFNHGTLAEVTMVHTASPATGPVTLGTSTAVVHTSDYDVDRSGDPVSGQIILDVTVTDDDPANDRPDVDNLDNALATWGSGASGKYLVVATNGVIVEDRNTLDTTSTGTVYRVSDGYLAHLTSVSNVQFVVGSIDSNSAISQGSSGTTNEISTFSIGAALSGDAVKPAFSGTGPSTNNATVTNIWTFTDSSVFSLANIQSLYLAQTQQVLTTLVDADNDRADDRSVRYGSRVGFFFTYDDDTTAPLIGSAITQNNSGLSMDFRIGGRSYYASNGVGTAALFRVSDAELSAIGSGSPMEFVFNSYDPQSALSINATAVNLNVVFNYDVGTNPALQNLYQTYSGGLSTANTTLPNASNVFYHPVNFTIGGFSNNALGGFIETGEVYALMTADGYGIGTNLITVSAPNDDRDRGTDSTAGYVTNDTEKFINKEMGRLVVYDDDSTAPTARLEFVGFDWVKGQVSDTEITDAELAGGGGILDFVVGWYDSESGVQVTNNVSTLNNNAFSPDGTTMANWDMYSPTGLVRQDFVFVLTNRFSDINGAAIGVNGDTDVYMAHLDVQPIAFAPGDIGTWTITVSAQNFDLDRGVYTRSGPLGVDNAVSWDREIRTNQMLTFSVTDDDTNMPSVLLGPCTSAVSGLEMHLPMDEDQYAVLARDASGYGRHGTNSGAVIGLNLGQVGGSVDFERSESDYLETGGWDIVGSNLTLAAWIRLESVTAGNKTIVSKGSGASSHRWTLMVKDNLLEIRLGTTTVTGPTALSADVWYHVAAVYDGTQIQLYLNGAAEGSPGARTGVVPTGSEPVRVGARGTTAPAEHYDGLLDEIGVWSRALTLSELNCVYSAGLGGLMFQGALLLDAQTFSGGWSFTTLVADVTSGINTDGVPTTYPFPPYYNLRTADGRQVVTNRVFEIRTFADGGAATNAPVIATNVPAVALADNVLGVWTALITVADNDVDRSLDYTVITGAAPISVADDDYLPPHHTNITYGGLSDANRPFWVATNGFALQGTIRGQQRLESTGTSTLWAVTDAELADAGSRSLTFAFGVRDAVSTIGRGASGTTNTVLNFRIGDVHTDDFANYAAGSSSANGVGLATTNVWVFDNTDFSEAEVSVMLTNFSNPVYLTMPDADADRTSDVAVVHNVPVGFLRVKDDDIDAFPVVQLKLNSNLAVNVASGFESEEGWTTISTFGTNTVTANDGQWRLVNVKVDGLQAESVKKSQVQKADFNDTASSGTNTWLQMPPASDPGTVFFWARNSSGTLLNRFTVDYWPSGSNGWINVNLTNSVNSTNLTRLAFPINYEGNAVTVRVVGVDIQSALVHVDDMVLTRLQAWTNSSQVHLSWNSPTGDLSGVSEFRYTNNCAFYPENKSNGTSIALNTNVSFAAVEGTLTGYVFMVDNDNDRLDDRDKGMSVPYISRIDLTAPNPINVTNAEPGDDDTSEINLGWDPAPDAGGAALSPWDSYVIYLTDDGSPPSSTNFTEAFRDSNEAALDSITARGVVLSNLIFGLDYRAAIVGLDRAGNQSPVSGVVTVQLEGFLLTQGVQRVSGVVTGAHLAWTAGNIPITRDFDLLYVDRITPGFHESVTDEWAWVSTVTNSFYFDTGSASRISPVGLGSRMRFYRAARKNRWLPTANPRVASREIYVAKALQLKEGENWVSLLMIPDSNTADNVLGRRLPSSGFSFESTQVEWYGPTQNGGATNTIWLDTSTGWRFIGGGSANDISLPLNEGFNIVIPEGGGDHELLVVGKIPTNTTAAGGHIQTLQAGGTYNVVSYNIPYRISLTNSGLREAGFTGTPTGQAVNPNNSDEIRILQRGGGSLASPKVRILMDATGKFVYWSGGPFLQSAENYEFEVDDAIIIYTRRSTSNLSWTQTLPYPVPSQNISP